MIILRKSIILKCKYQSRRVLNGKIVGIISVKRRLCSSCLIEDLQVIEDLQKTYGRPTKIGDIYIKSDAILLIGIS